MKKYMKILLIGLVLVITGFVCLSIETISYKRSDSLTSNFVMKQKIFEYEISDKDSFLITNDNTNKNMNLYIDNNLSNKIKIVVIYSDLLKIDNNYYVGIHNEKEIKNVNIESDLIIDFDSIKDFYKLSIDGIQNKTIYNYTLLKYPEIKIFINEKYKSNVKLVDKDGKKYSPIR